MRFPKIAKNLKWRFVLIAEQVNKIMAKARTIKKLKETEYLQVIQQIKDCIFISDKDKETAINSINEMAKGNYPDARFVPSSTELILLFSYRSSPNGGEFWLDIQHALRKCAKGF